MKNGKIGVTTENIFPVIKKFLYSDHEIFLRELISNSVDATQKLKALASMGDVKGDLGDLTIRVSADKDAKTLTVTDRGIGMTADESSNFSLTARRTQTPCCARVTSSGRNRNLATV